MKPKTNFTLLRNLVMIYPIQAKQTSGGIIVTSITEPNAPLEGFVVAVGPGDYNKQGDLVAPEVKPGDRVVYIKSNAKELKNSGETFVVVPETEILCKVS